MTAKSASKSKPSAADRLAELQRRFQSARAEASFAPEKDRLEDFESAIPELVTQTKRVRDMGYLFETDLEARCLRLRSTWLRIKPALVKELEAQANGLADAVKGLEVLMRGARSAGPAQASAIDRLEAAMDDAEDKIKNAQRSVRGLHDSFGSDLSTMRAHLQQLTWMMEQAAESSLDWLPTEALLRAVPAHWVRNKGNEPRGILYLSDQRLLFEQKEDIATKKVLFITTEKKRVQEPMLAAALTTIEDVTAAGEGLLGHQDHLYLTFGAQGPAASIHFHLDGQDSEEWQAAIQRTQRHEFDGQRVEPVSQSELARLRRAPTSCASCAATFHEPVLRGQTEIVCAYCASVTRI